MKNFLLNWVWQFPQKLLGVILIAALKAEKRVHGEHEYYHFVRDCWLSRFISGTGLVVIILSCNNNTAETLKHEYGHTIQSKYLGWLYLPIIGIYSAVFCNLWLRWFHKDWNRYDRHYWYYITRWTESWADRLGGVDRRAVLASIPRPANARFPAQENQRKE